MKERSRFDGKEEKEEKEERGKRGKRGKKREKRKTFMAERKLVTNERVLDQLIFKAIEERRWKGK